MASTSSPVPDAHMSIKGVPKYMNYVYEWNWLTIVFFISIAYTVPCILVFLKIVFFYFKNRSAIRKSGLRVEIFQTFILMQLFGVLLVISEFLLFRIPLTSLATSYCASENPQMLLRFTSFFYYSMCYSSQLLTAFFCGLRVAILFSVQEKKTKLAVFIVPVIIVVIAILFSYPHILSYGMCIQMFGNFPFGSIVVISVFSYFNLITLEIEDMTVVTVACLAIIILNFLTFKKLRKTRSLNNVRSATQTNNIERTLTRTMVILLVPLLVHFLIDAAILFQVFSFAPTLLAHVMLLRPWFLDLRVHTKTVQIEDMLIITFTCLSIIVLTALTLRKIRKTRFLNNQRSAVQGATIEKTLTRTMIILLIPLLVHFLNAAAVLFQVFSIFPSLVSHALLLRPWFLDLRVHAATVYFYRTHPIFKSHKKLVNVSSSQNVRV
ncbi:unnamed protein product [Caenorhabditis brenneri]